MSQTKKPLYMWTGSEWILVGDGTGISQQAASSIYLSKSNASVIYATKEELANIDLSPYLTQANASSIYLAISGGNITGNLIIDGDLTVSGSTTYLNVNELNIEDNLIVLNYGVSGSPSLSAGIEIERGSSPNVSIQWNESNDRWEFTKDGSTFKELGSGAVLYQSASPDAVALGLEVGSVWIDSDATIGDALGESHIHGQYLSVNTASSTYLTQNNASSLYLIQTTASSTYATISNLNSGIVTASAAAYSSASVYTDAAIASFEALPSQGGNSGKYLSTDGSQTSWQEVDALPSQTGNDGKYLITNGASASWTTLDLSTKADRNLTINQQADNYVLVLSDNGKLVEMNSENSLVVTVPSNSSVEFPIGSQITILRTSAGSVTLQGGNGVLVESTPGLNLRAQWSSATLIKRATDSWVAIGDLTA